MPSVLTYSRNRQLFLTHNFCQKTYLFDTFSHREPSVLASFSEEFRAFIFFLVVISSSELTVSMKTLEAGRDSWWYGFADCGRPEVVMIFDWEFCGARSGARFAFWGSFEGWGVGTGSMSSTKILGEPNSSAKILSALFFVGTQLK